MPPRRRSSRRWSGSRSQHSGFAAAAARAGLFSGEFGPESPQGTLGKTAQFEAILAVFWPENPGKHDKMPIFHQAVKRGIDAKNKTFRQDFLETESHFRTSYV